MNKITTLQRGLEVLSLVCRKKSLSFSEIMRHLDLATTTVSRLLTELIEQRWLLKDPLSGKYVPGKRIGELNVKADFEDEIIRKAESHLKALRNKTGHTAILIIKEGNMMTAVAKCEHTDSLAMQSIGTVHSEFVAYPWGWFIWEQMTAKEKKQIPDPIKGDQSYYKEYEKGIKYYRKHGYCYLKEKQSVRLGAPIMQSDGKIKASLGMAIPPHMANKDLIEKCGKELVLHSQTLGET